MKNYDKLKKVIQEANPEIVEPKLPDFPNYIGMCRKVFGVDDNGKIQFPSYGCQAEDIFKEMKKGRPIRLADVLLAYNEIKSSMSARRFAIYFDGQIVVWDDNDKAHKECIWNLKDNNLDNQSDETKWFLIDLLT